MAIYSGVDQKLLDEAVRLGHHKSKNSAVRAALEEYIRRQKQLGIFDLFGKIEYVKGYSHKRERKRKRG